jgi:hypothetical protein
MEEIQINNNITIHNSKSNPQKIIFKSWWGSVHICHFTIFELMKQKFIKFRERFFFIKK